MLIKMLLILTILFALSSCNSNEPGTSFEIDPVIESEISDKTPSEITSYLESKYRDKCAEEIVDGFLFESVFYRKGDHACLPQKRTARCEGGNLVVEGDEAFTELSCEVESNNDPGICRKGKVLKIGIDRNDDGIVDDYVGDVLSYKGDMSAADNFNYYSWSAHPLNGLSPKGYAHHIYFYEGHDGLSLQFYYNVDAGGSANNKVNVELDVFNNELDDRVILSDDRGEIKKHNISEDHNKYLGKYHYWYNTDGGVIGPLGGEQFRIVLRPKDYGDVSESKFYSADGSIINLMTDDQDYSYIIEYKEENICEDGSFVQCEEVNTNYLQDSSFESHGILSQEEIAADKSKWDVLKDIGAWKSFSKAKSGIEVQVSNKSFAGLKAIDGYAKVELDAHKKNGFKKSHSHMYQDFMVEKDKNYSLSFFHAARVSSDTNRFKVKLSKKVNDKWQRVFEKSYENRTRAWKESKLSFQAEQELYRVEFMGIGHENSYGAYIDNVRVLNSNYFLLTAEQRAECSDQPVDNENQDGDIEDEDENNDEDSDVEPILLDPIVFINPSEAQLTNKQVIDIEGICYEGATIYLSGDIMDKTFLCVGEKFSGSVEISNFEILNQGVKIISGYQQLGESVSQPSQVNFKFDSQIPVVSISQIDDVNFRVIDDFKVQGRCSENGRKVEVQIGNVLASVNCVDLLWESGLIDISQIEDGSVTVSANHSDSAGNMAIEATQSFVKDTRVEKPIAHFSTTSFNYPLVDLNSSLSQVQGAGRKIVKRTWGIIDSLNFSSVESLLGNVESPNFQFPKDCAKYEICLIVEDDLGLKSLPFCQNFESARENIQLAISNAGNMLMTWDMFDGETIDVNWGDESSSKNVSGDILHFYEEPANRSIEVSFCAAAVKKLDLSRSSDEPRISGVIPDLSRLTKVEDINISGNDISGEIPKDRFPSSSNLIVFDISENKLTGSLDTNLFRENINLERLDFKFNNLSGSLPANLFDNNKKLKSLEFQRNSISGSLHKDLFDGLSSLLILDLSNNEISGSLNKELLEDTHNLERFLVNSNQLDGNIAGEFFEKTLELRNINLSDNRLTGDIPENLFSFNPRISGVNLSRNQFSGAIPENMFAGLPLLGALYLNDNQLSGELANNLFANNELITLIDLSSNQLMGTLGTSLFISNIELSNLNLSRNQFSGIIASSLFSSNPKMERLRLDHNNIAGFESRDSLNQNTKLKNLNLSSNSLMNAPSLLQSSELNFIDISENSLMRSDLDNIIIELVSVGRSNGEVSLQGQSSGVGPNAQASIFINLLISRGWTVRVDAE